MKAAFILVGISLLGGVIWFGLAPRVANNLLIEAAIAKPLEDGQLGVFLTIDNQGGPDRLLAASSTKYDVSLYSPTAPDGPPVPNGRASLALDAAYIRIVQGPEPFEHGSLVPLTLTFTNAGDVHIKARLSEPAREGDAAEVGLFGSGEICRVGDGEPAPAIALKVEPEEGRWRINIIAEEFEFSEEFVDLYHVPGMGHGHIYVGGMKLGRLFDSEYLIGQLPPGRHEVRVTLNTNDHRAYVVGDIPVSASAFIVVD